jgi:hypothetical protein
MKLITRSLLAGLALGATALTARAAEVQHYRFNDKSATAEFSFVVTNDAGRVIRTDVGVQGGFQVVRDNGRTETPSANVFINVFDFTSNVRLLAAQGATSQQGLQIDANLKKARLKARIAAAESITNSTVPVDVDLVWSAAGSSDTYAGGYSEQLPGVTIAHNVNGTAREAVASGTVSIGTTDYTPEPSILGFIMKNAAHDVTITRP